MRIVALILILISIFFTISAQKVQETEIECILSLYQNQKSVQVLSIYSQKSKDKIAKVFYNDDSFIVISTDKKFSPVMAFSETNGIDISFAEEFRIFIESLYENEEKNIIDYPEIIQKHQQEWNKILGKSETKDITYGPSVQSLFGQVNCKDQNGSIINVTNLYTPQNVAVGCVAISQAIVLHYYGWPNQGMGTYNYTDNYGSLTGNHMVNYDSSFYQMDLIKNYYHNQVSSIDERKALGKLTYESAVSIDMDFESGGSTSNIDHIPDALNSHFRLISKYNSISVVDFWQKLDSNIKSELPVILAVKSDNGWGHSVVCSGLKELDTGTKYYHLNMGWWGTANGWYKIHEEFNANGYTSVTGGVFNIVPNAHLYEPEFNKDNNELSLKWVYPEFPGYDSYQLEMKPGRENWTVLENSYYDNTYTITLDGTSVYSFRVKPQSTNENIIWGWSNYITFSDYLTAIDDKVIQKQDFNCYPNPVKDRLYVKCDYVDTEKCSVEIFNSNTNSFIVDYSKYGDILEIYVKDLPPNIYFLRIRFNNQFFTQTFLKI